MLCLRCGSAGTPAVKELAELARVVLDPAGDLSGKPLVVVGDGVLRYVPFAALPEATRVETGPRRDSLFLETGPR